MRSPLKAVVALAAAGALVWSAGCTARNDTPADDVSVPASTEATETGEFTVAFVPKLQGIPYFEAMNTGGQAAEADIPGLTWLYQGPTEADPAKQADIVRSLIQQKVDVLIVAPNDPDSLAPVLEEAKAAGIKVATADTDAPNSVRDVFVNQATAEGLGTTIAETLAAAMGGKGTAAIVSCGETAENLNSWIAVEEATFASQYPDIKLLPTVYAGEDQAKATEMATDLMNANPDLTGLIGQCTTSAPGVAQAVKDAGKIGTVFTTGLGTPQAMLPYLEDGSSSGSVLWDVEGLGYLAAWAGAQLYSGTSFQATQTVGDLQGVTWDAASKTLLLGPPTVFTKDNAGQYDY
ncbi:MAG: autoinducer 2 ABC transporter substrate-binding protein [Propionibacteriaceae bacterium]|jgi:rhamnose transport system substrate-binding protein|nr:autoinducer 2 ABC transporter substrate-binding protein [Propionibacteriaceae bacterium]